MTTLETKFLRLKVPVSPHNVLAVTYSGNHGYYQALTNSDANSFIASSSQYAKTGFGGLPFAAPDPRFLTMNQVLLAGHSNYDALTVQVRHGFSLGHSHCGGSR